MRKLLILLLLPFLIGATFSGVKFQSKPNFQYWVNDGADKVTQDEMRITNSDLISDYNTGDVINNVWDGTTITLRAAKNETVSFSLYIESSATIEGLTVEVETFDEDEGAGEITTEARDGDITLFDYTGRNIELFYTRYLKQEGVSEYHAYTEYQYSDFLFNPKMSRPRDTLHSNIGSSSAKKNTLFKDRPWANKMVPEILVPLELHTPFGINAYNNQQIWCDVTTPDDATVGDYSSNIIVKRNGKTIKTIPITLTIDNFMLPHTPTKHSWVWIEMHNLWTRFTNNYFGGTTQQQTDSWEAIVKMFWRHKTSVMVNDPWSTLKDTNQFDAGYYDYTNYSGTLDGTFFTEENGYDGPGTGVNWTDFYIGTYGVSYSVGWASPSALGVTETDRQIIQDHVVNWNDIANLYPNTDFHIYLCDEGGCSTSQVEQHSDWIDDDAVSNLKSYATISVTNALASANSLDSATSTTRNNNKQWEALGHEHFYYNGVRPFTPDNHLDNSGVSMFIQHWIAYDWNWDNFWYYNACKWTRGYGSEVLIDAYNDGKNYGPVTYDYDEILGLHDSDYNPLQNWLDGILTYPGKDLQFPDSSYGIEALFPGIMLKQVRRGVQDIEYLTQAAAIDEAATEAIIQKMIPMSYFDTQQANVGLVTTWSEDPDDWNDARDELRAIILGE